VAIARIRSSERPMTPSSLKSFSNSGPVASSSRIIFARRFSPSITSSATRRISCATAGTADTSSNSALVF
jgi:hypothetical protein